ncbi:Ig-like domain-containing protein [Mastigocoleus testarum]|uniref:DUF4114 domain-containing protein n=1 Tax=Mastigocoleus testarum BC008 TaxID=371196 RepID=A0A0V7ZCC0_9CYAN|nr:Ig-like domain-containing protein [Mastigocoleus testarum]KST62145.1 hypothetical protein BC008_37485 [Mastigocoleus testarum BC008]
MTVNSDGKFFADFNSGIPSEFTVDAATTNTESVQNFDGKGTKSNVFSGNFLRNVTDGPGNKTTLTLENLPTHTSVDLNFLLAIIDTWDGDIPGFGNDFFNVTIDGVSIFKETLTNINFSSQSYTPATGVKLGTDNFFSDTSGSYPTSNDSAYDMGLDPIFNNIVHTADTLTIEWFSDGSGWEGNLSNRNESWAIDNVEVILNGLDKDAPGLISTTKALSPADDSTNVPKDASLVITFDEDVRAAVGNIIIKNADGSIFEKIDASSERVTTRGNTVTIDPINDFVASTGYYVEVESGAIEDLAGNDFLGISDPTVWNFITAADPDTTPPAIDGINGLSPADDSTDVPKNANLTIAFNENIRAGTGNIIIKTADGDVVEIIDINSDRVTIDDNTVTIDPINDFNASTNYYVEVENEAIEDLAGNDFLGISDPTVWNFITAADPDTTPPVIDGINGLSPADDSTDVPKNANLTIAFNENVRAGTGNIIIKTADGDVVEIIDINSDRVIIDENTVKIDPTNDFATSTSYYVEIESGAIEDLAGNDFSGISNSQTWNFTTSLPSNEALPELEVDDNGVFRVVGETSKRANLKAQFISSHATYINELGVFVVNDERGTIIDPKTKASLTPDAGDDYIQAALKQSKVLFSALPQEANGFDSTELSRTIEGFDGKGFSSGDRLVFYLVSNSTTDTVLGGKSSTEKVLLGATFDSDTFHPVKVTSEDDGGFNLSWEDEIGGGDGSFEDLVVKLQLTEEPIAKGTESQGDHPAELIDLRGESGLVNFNYSVYREAEYNNEVYLYQIDNPEGLIGSLDPNNSSKSDYLQAALDNVVKDQVTGEVIKFTAENNSTHNGSASVEGGALFAPIIIINGTLEQLTDGDNNNDPEVYFPYMGANSDGFDHVNLLGDNTFGFEDTNSNSDKDYNDLIVDIDFV